MIAWKNVGQHCIVSLWAKENGIIRTGLAKKCYYQTRFRGKCLVNEQEGR